MFSLNLFQDVVGVAMCLRSYKRISEQQHTAVSNLLVAGKSPDLVTNSTSQAILPFGSPLKVLQPLNSCSSFIVLNLPLCI